MLLTLPPELVHNVALHLATAPPNLGPPAALLPLLLVCKRLYDLLGWRRNRAFWARVGAAKFSSVSEGVDGEGYVPYEGYPWVGLGSEEEAHWAEYDARDGHNASRNERGSSAGRILYAALALRTRCAALSIIRRGDPYAPGAPRALQVAYGMLLEDEWAGERLDWTTLDTVLGRDPSLLRPHVHDDEALLVSAGKNRRQLAWAGVRSFALRYVRDRLYQGRFGERDPDVDAEHAHEPSDIQALRREARSEWRPEWDDPAWRVGWPRDTEPVAAALWVMWFFESEETLRAEPESLRRHIMTLLLPMVAAPFRYPSALAPPHHYTVPLLAADHAAATVDPERNANGLTFQTHHGPYPIYPLRAPSHQSQDAGSAPSTRASSSSSSSSSPVRDVYPGRRRRSRRGGFPPSRSRLLAASPARLLFFARMQAGQRFDVPPLPRTRAEAAHAWQSSGNTGPLPIRPTQEDLHEKNARPLVRFERPLPFSLSFSPATPDASGSGSAPDPISIPSPSAASTSALAVDPDLDAPSSLVRSRPRRDERWAPYRWRARLCRGYAEGRDERGRRYSGGVVRRSGRGGARDVDGDAASSRGAAPAGTSTGTGTGQGQGKGGAPPGRIGRVYPLGAFAGLWAGTMLMPSEPPYTALIATPGGRFPPGGLPRDDFIAAARPVYMRIREHWSFAPDTPAPPPPPDSTTADEGLRTGWLPPGTHVVGVGGGKVEVRCVPADAWASGRHARAYKYHTPLDARAPAGAHPAHDVDACPGCVGVRERERWAREVAAGSVGTGTSTSASAYAGWGEGEDADMEDREEYAEEEEARGSSSGRWSSRGGSVFSQAGPASSSSEEQSCVSGDRTPCSVDSDDVPWPEWNASAWAAHRFDEDEGWETACDGVQDVIFEGETDPRHGMAWHHYEYAGRVRPWDGLIGLIMRPRDRTLGLATFFISGHLAGRDTFEGTWQMASQDVLAPSWGGSICLARGEE